MAYPIIDEQEFPRTTPAVQCLVGAIVGIYFLQLALFGGALPRALGFQVSQLTERPWTILTFMFVHGGWAPVALNAYVLWLVGPRLERAWNAVTFACYFVVCGLGGWLVYLLVARDGLLIGSTSSVLGVALAYAMRSPDDEVMVFGMFPVRARWLVPLLVLVDLPAAMMTAGPASPVSQLAHLGGLGMGYFIMIRTASIRSLSRLRERISHVPDIPDETPRAIPRSHPRPRERERGQEIDEIVARSNAVTPKRQIAAAPTGGQPGREKEEEQQLDLVLDKISRQGLESLTSEERRLLEDVSRRLRDD